MNITLFVNNTDNDKISYLNDISKHFDICLNISIMPYFKNKIIINELINNQKTNALLLDNNQLFLVNYQNNQLIKVTNDWHLFQKRVVNAGRKSELLLQACKLSDKMTVIDGTAGFGIDSLILASTGAKVLMIEQNPLIGLLLYYQKTTLTDKNWQALLSRLYFYFGDNRLINFDDKNKINSIDKDFFDKNNSSIIKSDVMYLDPMFPKDSYNSKVGKSMQILHTIITPPNNDELSLLKSAKNLIKNEGSIIIKRPINSPFFANKNPLASWSNNAVRFDKY